MSETPRFPEAALANAAERIVDLVLEKTAYAELVAALRPFAACFEPLDARLHGKADLRRWRRLVEELPAGDFRRAAEAVEKADRS